MPAARLSCTHAAAALRMTRPLRVAVSVWHLAAAVSKRVRLHPATLMQGRACSCTRSMSARPAKRSVSTSALRRTHSCVCACVRVCVCVCVSSSGRGVDAAEGAAAQLGIMLPPSLASHTSHAIRQGHTCSACPSACQCPVTRSRSTRSVSLTPPSEDISTAAAEHDAVAAVPAPAAAAGAPAAPTTVEDFVADHNIAPETSLGVVIRCLKTIIGWDRLTEPEGDGAGTTLGAFARLDLLPALDVVFQGSARKTFPLSEFLKAAADYGKPSPLPRSQSPLCAHHERSHPCRCRC